MRRKNRGKLLFSVTMFVITCSHIALSQTLQQKSKGENVLVIKGVNAYKTTLKADPSQKMVLTKSVDPNIFIDLKYGTKDNFTGQVLYANPQAYLRLPVALALKKVNDELRDSGFALKIWDAYRPYSVTKKMWKLVHDRRYVANPAKGSAHNRGTAVDLTLVKTNGQEVPMPTPFDDFTEKASHNYTNLPPDVLRNTALLKKVMRKHGFAALPTEWWHYLYVDSSRTYEVLDLGFGELVGGD